MNKEIFDKFKQVINDFGKQNNKDYCDECRREIDEKEMRFVFDEQFCIRCINDFTVEELAERFNKTKIEIKEELGL